MVKQLKLIQQKYNNYIIMKVIKLIYGKKRSQEALTTPKLQELVPKRRQINPPFWK